MKRGTIVVALIVGLTACGRGQSETQSGERTAVKNEFFESLSSLCGNTYHGETLFPDDPDDEMVGADLTMHIESCGEDEIRIPFIVNEDSSRTWVITLLDDDTLLLKHDHRYPDGTPHSLTNYGGFASDNGTESSQFFEADQETKDMLPEASTNVWMMELNTEENKFVYYLERHNESRYRAEFEIE